MGKGESEFPPKENGNFVLSNWEIHGKTQNEKSIMSWQELRRMGNDKGCYYSSVYITYLVF